VHTCVPGDVIVVAGVLKGRVIEEGHGSRGSLTVLPPSVVDQWPTAL